MAKVLIVDDETPIALLLEYYLGSVGHTVTSARSSLGSLSWLDMERFDVAIIDVMMPGPMDGLDVCRVLKGDPKTASTRVLVISGVPGMEPRANSVGADAFLPKPFALDDVSACVDRLASLSNPRKLNPGPSLRSAIERYPTAPVDVH